MKASDVQGLEVLHQYLVDVTEFLEIERSVLDRLLSYGAGGDRQSSTLASRLDPLLERLPRMVEATRGIQGWLPEMESSITSLLEELDAQRREHAQPGQILLSEAAHERTKDIIEAVPLDPIKVKGRSSLEKVYELRGLRDG
jgi:hypothetical protein